MIDMSKWIWLPTSILWPSAFAILQPGEANKNVSKEGEYLFSVGSVRLLTLEEAFG